jgi:hypothetical protein
VPATSSVRRPQSQAAIHQLTATAVVSSQQQLPESTKVCCNILDTLPISAAALHQLQQDGAMPHPATCWLCAMAHPAGCLQVVFTCQLVRVHCWRVATAVCFAKIQRQAIAAAGPADCCQSHMTSGVHQAHHCLGRDSTAARAGAERLLRCWRK